MSSNIRIQRICQFCKKEFTAQKTTSKTCSDRCASKLYKLKIKTAKIEASSKETIEIRMKPLLDLRGKEILTVKEVSILLSWSLRTVYKHIQNGNIKAVNLSARLTRIKRSEIDKLFE